MVDHVNERPAMTAIPTGRYRHYKGREYSVLDVARHSETAEELVVYRQEYGERRLWVRPQQMFLELVDVGGQRVPRFQYLGPEPADSEPADGESGGETAAGNLFGVLPASSADEFCQTILHRDGLRIEQIVSRGHASPDGFWYDQPQSEFVVLVRGAARLQFDGAAASVRLEAGDFLEIPAHRRHRVEWTDPDQPTVWLAIHFDTKP
jgi:cupin 2 domain-containing protein